MGVPKKRTSRQKRDSRRAHWKATAPNVGSCPKCGFYKGKAVQKGSAD
jgi:large subunit ribosomal protein L32